MPYILIYRAKKIRIIGIAKAGGKAAKKLKLSPGIRLLILSDAVSAIPADLPSLHVGMWGLLDNIVSGQPILFDDGVVNA